MIVETVLALALAHASSTKTVAVRDDFYGPKSVTIKKGSKVRWKWHADSVHNVTVTRGPVKFSSSLKTSGSYTKKFRKKGTYKILCTVHAPSMKMTVKVK